jgi:hypothetical protein
MKILYDQAIVSTLKQGTLFVDTNTLIAAIKYDITFGKLFNELSKIGCSFITIPSVLFEYTRGSD